ncbi:MAG: Ig-like domain-containing protein [Solirubrobacterales bacterium]
MGKDRLRSWARVSRGGGLRGALLVAVLVSLLLPGGALAADTAIDSGPAGLTNDNTPTFGFSSPDDPAATFECRIDDDPFAACSGPGDTHTPAPLADGAHTFAVRAIDAEANPDPDPATRTFTVDTDPPNTTITSGPGELSNDNTPTFGFSSGDAGATFECRVDGNSFAACGPGSHTIGPLADGPHTFRVRATDAAGNADQSPASRDVTIDTTAPDTTIGFGPDGPTSDDTPSFGVSSEPGARLQCRIDDEPFAACGVPDGGGTFTTAALADGPHTFRARAIDAAGNADPSPASREFTVDTTRPPDTTITKRPKSRIKTKQKRARVVVSFTGEAGVAYSCKLDGGRYRPCKSPYSATVRSKSGKGGKHRIMIRATDEVGNVGRPVAVRFRVLRTPRLRASVAKRTVITALNRHGFAHRVVKSVRIDCKRRGRYGFGCRFSSRFRGYQLSGRGAVKLGAGLSYRFRVKAQGVRFLLTDRNETSRLR